MCLMISILNIASLFPDVIYTQDCEKYSINKGAFMTKEELKEYQHAIKNINLLEEQLAIIDSKLTRTTSILSDLPKGKSSKDMTNELTAKRIEIENTINKNLAKAYTCCSQIEKAIDSLSEREKLLMRLRYIKCFTWEEICADMGYSWNRIHYIHREALRQISS